MLLDENKLKIVSNETLDSVKKIEIVTPTIYKSVFTKNASLHNISIEDEEKLTEDILNDKISAYQEIESNTTKNALRLSDNTSRAISAIKDKDEESLKQVLKETQELRKEIEKLKESLYTDELTLTHNRKWLHDTFLNQQGCTINSSGVLAIVDLNFFKLVNDTYGHIIGDKVLIFIAKELKKANENVLRYGGDEFIILFSNKTKKTQALKKLHQIREKILHKKLKANDSEFKISFSFGACEFSQGDKLSTIIEKADEEMYKDKTKIKKEIGALLKV